jgi:hypothetical protein
VVELADTQVLGTCAERLGGSSPLCGTLLQLCYNNFMKRFLTLAVAGLILLAVLLPFQNVRADSEQAYADYLFNLDIYRKAYNEFKVAKNEYDKFKTLTSQTTALEKTIVMLDKRDRLLRAYLQFLLEKLNENPGLSDSEKSLYQKIITNENTFLDVHSNLIPSIGSISDALDVSQQLESHYLVLQTSIRQTILGLTLGQLQYLYRQYIAEIDDVTKLVDESRQVLSIGKQSVADRWIVSINSKRSLYEQKVNSISPKIASLKAQNIADLDRQMGLIQKDLGEAKTHLLDGSSYIKELMDILRYKD